MNEEEFWELVESAKRAADPSVESRPEQLEILLSRMPLEAIQEFQRWYEAILLRANRWSLWGAAYIMNGGCSDDGFKYFRDWLISEGRSLFNEALKNPESLAVSPRREYFELEIYGYAALKAYEKKGGGEIERNFQAELAMPEGKEWSEAELPALFPKLAAAYDVR